jgi:putative transposase
VAKSGLYYEKRPMKDTDKMILNRVDEIYTDCPFYGARKISKELKRRCGINAGRKKVGSMAA